MLVNMMVFIHKSDLGKKMYFHQIVSKSKLGFLSSVQQPGSYWDRSSALSFVGVESTQR